MSQQIKEPSVFVPVVSTIVCFAVIAGVFATPGFSLLEFFALGVSGVGLVYSVLGIALVNS